VAQLSKGWDLLTLASWKLAMLFTINHEGKNGLPCSSSNYLTARSNSIACRSMAIAVAKKQ
jgi:hypothetical protein